MTDTIEQPTELELLKERATDMGITFNANIGVDKLREKVNAKLATPTEPVKTGVAALKAEALKLVRIRITCLNPNKKEFEAEYFKAGNSLISTVTRIVPFEIETHVEQIIFNAIKARQVAYVRNEKNSEGHMVPVRKLRNEFQVEVLPPLTEAELKKLAIDQSKRQANN